MAFSIIPRIEESQPMNLDVSTDRASNIVFSGQNANANCFITIAIPTYKRFSLLEETLDSVVKQRFDFPYEILIMDNDPDNYNEAFRFISKYSMYPVNYKKNIENYGMFGNWNQCISNAKGHFITLLHDDDLLKPSFSDWINKLYHQFISGEKFSIAGSNVEIYDQRNTERPQKKSSIITLIKKMRDIFLKKECKEIINKNKFDLFSEDPFIGTLGVIFERKKAIDISGFNENLFPIADYDFWMRWAITYGEIPVFSESVAKYRIQVNESMNIDTMQKFSVANRENRIRLISSGCYPSFFIWFVSFLYSYERDLFEKDWGVSGQVNPVFFLLKKKLIRFVFNAINFLKIR